MHRKTMQLLFLACGLACLNFGVSASYVDCMTVQCPWISRVPWPEGWGSNATNDVAFIRSNQNAATSVHCVCRHCGEFEDLRNWPAYQLGACDIAGQNALKNNPYPAGTCGANDWGSRFLKCDGDKVPYVENDDISDPQLFVIGDNKETCCQPKHPAEENHACVASCPSTPTDCHTFHRSLSFDGGCAASCPNDFVEKLRYLCDHDPLRRQCGPGT